MLKRPRNRQPRPDGQSNQRNNNNSNRGGRQPQSSRSTPPSSRPYVPVPNVQQVVPGASVSIVLKEDQPTGRETPGIVQDVLTQGNHPRGMKVRLRDGQVGRVQRMLEQGWEEEEEGQPQQEPGTNSGNGTPAGAAATATASRGRFSHKYTDVRNDDYYMDEPPPRSLADFFPEEPTTAVAQEAAEETQGGPTVPCPFCSEFEGDEMAVSYHIDQKHLT